MRADVKIALCNELVARTILPVLEEYHGRQLSQGEKIAVFGHINMLFMEPCPLRELLANDDKFARALLQPRN